MYSPLQLSIKYLRYYISASNGRGHGVHSPFVFDFIRMVLLAKKKELPAVESVRKQLLRDKTVLHIEDKGAGSGVLTRNSRMVMDIARSSLKPKRYAALLNKIVTYYNCNTVIELGTSFGITTSYIASSDVKVHTLEGSDAIAFIAENNFRTLHLENISLIRGNFDDTLKPLLEKIRHYDLAFVDGNHRKTPTINYFKTLLQHSTDTSILIFDDIHWSEEMESAWEEIKNDPSVSLTIDLFFIGIVFFRKEFKVKQHFCIRF